MPSLEHGELFVPFIDFGTKRGRWMDAQLALEPEERDFMRVLAAQCA